MVKVRTLVVSLSEDRGSAWKELEKATESLGEVEIVGFLDKVYGERYLVRTVVYKSPEDRAERVLDIGRVIGEKIDPNNSSLGLSEVSRNTLNMIASEIGAERASRQDLMSYTSKQIIEHFGSYGRTNVLELYGKLLEPYGLDFRDAS